MREPKIFKRLVTPLLLTMLLVTPFLTMTFSSRAQGQIFLRSIEPSEGRPGQELELTLRGGGFGGANEVGVSIEGVEVWEAWIVSEQEIGVQIYIPEDAWPGPRPVEVFANFGPNEDFPAEPTVEFTVLDGEPGLPPRPDDDDGDLGWLIPVVIVALGLGGVALAASLTLNWRRSTAREQWQSEAQEELPEHCQGGTHHTVREKPEIKPGRWKVKGLKATMYDAASERQVAVHGAPSDLVEKIDKAARHRLLRGETDKLATQVAEIARELTALVLDWQSQSRERQDVLFQARLEGGEASTKFIRYRCVGEPGQWQKQLEWTAKLQALDLVPGRIRGPETGETSETYRVALGEGLGHYVADLIREASRLL
jgi:hypothetical protein